MPVVIMEELFDDIGENGAGAEGAAGVLSAVLRTEGDLRPGPGLWFFPLIVFTCCTGIGMISGPSVGHLNPLLETEAADAEAELVGLIGLPTSGGSDGFGGPGPNMGDILVCTLWLFIMLVFVWKASVSLRGGWRG